ncbi:MAG: diaminopimelate epimerase [Kiritimatiellae bacterium]|nr:diaminopimelate epimerase [Kiritimatiellia bacterium]
MKKLLFTKMHGAGNDFIVSDNRFGLFPSHDANWIRTICHRNHGIGSEGLLLLETDKELDFSMRFFNPDGSEAAMCGNGARCIALFARSQGIAGGEMTFRSAAGPIRATVLSNSVRIQLPPPHSIECGVPLSSIPLEVDCINTGVLHAVAFVEDLQAFPLERIGPLVRFHARFAPEGINFNAVQRRDDGTLDIRTHERGVEAETPACGTGITAAALLAARRFGLPTPITVRCAHGDILQVSFKPDDAGGFAAVELAGPAVSVFEGSIPYPGEEAPA